MDKLKKETATANVSNALIAFQKTLMFSDEDMVDIIKELLEMWKRKILVRDIKNKDIHENTK